MPDLASTDWLILLLYVLGSIGIGVSMRSTVKSGRDYFQAGRSLPTWVCAVAFISAGLGAPEVIGMGAAGANFGFRAALYFALGGIPALLCSGLFLVRVFYKSGAASMPGYLGLRFDAKTRSLSAVLFILMSLASAGIALFMTARILQVLRIFDKLFFAYGWSRGGIFLVCVLLAAVPVLIYAVVAGLRATIISQTVQFFLLVAGFLPVVWVGLNNVGGWRGLSASLAAIAPQSSAGASPATIAGAALVLGFVLGAARWTTDFRVLRVAMAAKNAESARKIPVIAAAVRLVIPFLLVLPGVIAVSMPTPQSKTVVRNENGAIYHEITIVPREISEGRGLVPALLDPKTNNARTDGAGHALLDYGMATPNMVTHFAFTGLLGLIVAGLLASLMSGVAAGVSAAATVFACDLYQPLRKGSSDTNVLRAGRWATAAAVILAVGMAFAIAARSGGIHETVIYTWLAVVAIVFTLLQAPQIATYLLGALTKRVCSNGAFAGLVAGLIAALLHYGLTLPAGAQPGWQGGWLAPLHLYQGMMTQLGFTVLFSFIANLAVAYGMSLATGTDSAERPSQPAISPKNEKPAKQWRNRPEAWAVAILLAAGALALIFA